MKLFLSITIFITFAYLNNFIIKNIFDNNLYMKMIVHPDGGGRIVIIFQRAMDGHGAMLYSYRLSPPR